MLTSISSYFSYTLFIVLALFSVSPAQAIIISTSTANTTLSNGNTVDLQGLEWLSLDQTVNMSRESIEAGGGGFIADGWRYATRTESETLINSLWGGTYNGWATDNYSGVSWFEQNFGMASYGGFGPHDKHSTSNGTSGFDNAIFFFGDIGECSFDLSKSCYAYISILDTYSTDLYSQNVTTFQTELSYQANTFGAGFIYDYYGANLGVDPNNITLQRDYSQTDISSLLVRSPVPPLAATSVPEPSVIALMGLGLLGFVATRHKLVE